MAKPIQKNVRLRQERLQRDWRQADLAEQLGTTELTVRRWERGSQQPSAYYRLKLCALFGKSALELGLIEADELPTTSVEKKEAEAAHTPSSPAQALALWTVPYPRNPHFTGREELLAQLEQHLSVRQGEADPAITRRAALTQAQAIKGLGGIGKTQIAVEYAYRAREQGRYTHILWINAASEETILTSFAALADLLPASSAGEEIDPRKLIAAITRWLEHCEQRWLLIFDNADDLSLVQEHSPHQGNGSVLLTSRSHAVGSLACSLEVENMGLVEGMTLLLRRAQRQQVSEEGRNEAMNVVTALDGFPLALDQAGAYIEETGCGFGDYLRIYQEHRQLLLARRGKQATNYPDSVATTWSLSFQRIEQANPAAAELLRLCSLLAPDHIPEELLKETAYWPAALQKAASDLFAFNQMLETLLAFSLVKRLQDEQTLSIHRLVQAVQLDAMAPEEQRQRAERVVCAMNALFPRNPQEEVATWSLCLRYLEQVQACDTLIQQHQLLLPEAAELLDRTGIYVLEHTSYTLAESLFQQALGIWEQVVGPDHPEVATSLDNLAVLYRKQGKYEQAEPLFLRALNIWERAVGPDHPKVAISLDNLAVLYRGQGKYEQAKPLVLRALSIREQGLGSDHPEVATSLDNLAGMYYEQGKYEQAEPLFLRALHIWEQAVGPDHLKGARSMYNLSGVYYEQKKYEQAELLLLRALHIWEQSLDPDHPQIAYPLLGLASLYYEQEKYEQVEPLYLRALHIWEQALSSSHPLVAYALNGLANLYRAQRKYAEAEALHQQALTIREQALGPQHPDTAEALYDFAVLREAQGRCQEAMALYQRALTIREHVYGSQHPKTLETRAKYTELVRAIG